MPTNCRLKYATDIADKIKDFGNLDKTSAKKLQENQYLLPIGGFNGENTKLETVKNTYEWGKKIQIWANNRYKNVGNMVDLRNTEDGTILTIQIPKILIDAYENKFGQMTDEDFQAAMDAEEYYNEQNISNISRGAKDPNIKAKYFKDSNVTTATTILDNIAKSGHSLNKLASKLIDFAKANNVKITLVKQIAKKEGDIVNSSAAVYNASTNTIEIREDASFVGYGSESTIIHEILHALTYKQLRDNNTTSKDFNKLYEHAKQFFPEWNKETQKGEYAIANSDEFLVALFTDAAFINKLKTIPSTSKVGEYTNFFQEIYDYILSLFNINSSDNKNLKDSLYGQAFAVASNILVDFKERNETNEFFQLNPIVKDTVSKKNELTETIFKGLEEYIKQNGIKVEFLDSLKAKYPNDPVAVYNHIRNTIEINKGEQTADTLAEELGHHLTLALGADHILVKRALNLIGRIDYKSELGQAYVDAYKGDTNLLKMEYLGKLIAKTIVNGYENPLGTTENEIKIWDTIIAMLNKFISLFNPNSNITSELDKVAFELSSMITSGTKLDVQKSPIDNIMLFQLNAENTSSKIEVKKGFPMHSSNFEKIEDREKSFTLRTVKHDSGIYKFGNHFYNVTNTYGDKVLSSSVNNLDYLKKKFIGKEDIRFEHIKEFFNGTESLYVYQIQRVDSDIENALKKQEEDAKVNKKVSEDLRQEVFYKREIGRLKNEINSMIKKGLNTDSKEAELKKIKDGIAELEATKNKQILINLSTDTLNTIEEFINNLSDPSKKYEALNGERIENILTTLHIFEDFIPTAERSMRLLKDLKPHIKQYVLEHVNKYSGREVTMEDLEKRDTDLFVGEKGFGTLADVKNYIGKTIGYLIKDAQGKIERANKVSFNELEKEIEAIEKYASTAGIPKKDIYKIFIQEYKDRKGKLTTILAKEYTSAFYTAISDTFKLPTAEEGKAARQALGTWNKEKERWEPRNSAYINKDYIKIQNTPALKRYYDYYKKSIAALGEELPVNLNENFIPNLVEKSLLDIIKSDKSVGGKLKEGVMSILDIYDVEHEENAFISEEDLLLDTVPLKYIGGISPELKSSDLSSSLLKFMYFTNSYKEMSEILPKARLLQEQIKESSFIKNTDKGRSIKGEDTNLNSMVESFINMQIKGEMKKDEKLGDFNYSKYIDFGLKYTSLLRIGLNPFNAITNILVGNIGNIIESVGGRHFSYANYVKAREIFFKDLGGDSKTNKLIEKYNPLMELEDYENLNKINIGSNEYKEKTKALMYAPQRLGEKYLQTSTMIASLLHDKVTTKDGKSISMWEAFDDNGVWKEELMGYPLTEDMIFKTTNKIQRINQMIHGRYSAKDAAALSQYSLFRMAFQFKKWIPAAIESRVQGRRFDDRLGVDTEGRYHTYMKFIQLNIAKLQGNKEKIESLKFDDTDLYNMRKNMMELVVVLSSTLMYIGLGWDDDDKKKGWYKFTMNQLDKVSGDMMFFYNPAEMNRNVGNTLPLIKSTGDLIKALKATQYLLGGKNSEYTKGKHANENKAIAAYLDVTPIAKPIADVIRNFNGQKYQAPTGR